MKGNTMYFNDVKVGKQVNIAKDKVEVKEINGKFFAIAKSPNGGHSIWKPVTRAEAKTLS